MTALHRWASRQDENFITDAFAHLLRQLLADNEAVGNELLSYLTDGRFQHSPGSKVEVKTQVTVSQGRPDIEIRSSHHLMYIEAKVESGLGEDQLERYLADLDNKSPNNSTLVVLSRYPVPIPEQIRERVVTRCWYHVGHWLHEELQKGIVKDAVSVFLINQLVGFFEHRNILMEKIGPELITGIRAFQSLLAMVGEAISARKMTMNKTSAREWAGYYFGKEQDFFLGLYYERPEFLIFETYNCVVIPNAADKLGFGKMLGSRLEWRLPLSSDASDFFSLTRGEQMDRIKTFLDDAIDAANKVRKNDLIQPMISPK